MKHLSLLSALLMIFTLGTWAQEKGHGGGGRGFGGGHIPAHGPAPAPNAVPAPAPRAQAPVAAPQSQIHPAPVPENRRGVETRRFADQAGHPEAPHVHTDNRWIGHDTGRNDANYRLERPYARGRFTADLAPATHFVCKAEIENGSGSMVSISA